MLQEANEPGSSKSEQNVQPEVEPQPEPRRKAKTKIGNKNKKRKKIKSTGKPGDEQEEQCEVRLTYTSFFCMMFKDV